MDRLDELVLKPVDGSGGKGIVIGPRATRAELDELRGQGAGRPARLDRPAGRSSSRPCRRYVDGRLRAAARRPAAVRGQRRQPRLGAARRADPGRARRGRADRELLPRRRLQGHLGARRPGRAAGARPSPSAVGRCHATPHRTPGPRPDAVSAPATTSAADQQQQQQPGRWRRAEPDRRVAVLDRPLRRARRGHRAHPRRADPAAARGPRRSTRRRPAATCSRSWASRSTTPTRPSRHRRGAARCWPTTRLPGLDRRGAGGGPRERPPGPRDAVDLDVGGASTRRTAPSPSGHFRSMRPPGRLPVGARARGADQRHRRRHDDPRRGLAVPDAGPLASSAPT